MRFLMFCWSIVMIAISIMLAMYVLSGCGPSMILLESPYMPTCSKPILTGGNVDNSYSALTTVQTGTARCTGFFITTRDVLTAAHCVSNRGVPTVTIGYLRKQADSYTIHPNYSGNDYYDVAIIHLAGDAPVEPLALSDRPVEKRDTIILLGKGTTGSPLTIDYLPRSGTNTIEWVNSHLYGFVLGPNVCNGDSGGPTILAKNGCVSGVHVSKLSGPCGIGGVDVRVDKHKGWIESVINGR